MVLPRPVRRPRRHPGGPRDDLPPGVRLPLPVLPRPDDLPRRGGHPRADPPQRHVEGLRRGFGRPAHVEPLRPARPVRLERLLLRRQPRAARRRPRPGHPVVRDEEPRLLLDGRVVHLRGVFLRGGQRLLAREAPGDLRHPGQRLRHLGPETAADGEPLRLGQLRELPEPQGHPLRRQGRPRLGPRASRGRGVRPERRGVRPRPRRLRADPLPLQLRPARALPRRGRARRRERAGPAPPLSPPPRRRGRLLRGGDPRDRGGEPAGLRGCGGPRPDRARPRPEIDPRLRPPRALGPRGGRPGDGTPDTGSRRGRTASPRIVADPRHQRDDEGPLPREPGHVHLGAGRRIGRQGRDLQRHEGDGEGVREPPRLQRPDRRGLHPRDGRRLLPGLRRREGHRRRGRVRRLLLAGGRADGRDVPRVLENERPVRPERHRAPRIGRLHRRRPLPLAEHRRVADDSPRNSHRRPGLRRRRRRAPADGGPVARHHPLPRAEVPLQLPALEDVRPRRLRGPVRQGAPPAAREGPDGPRVRNAGSLGARGRRDPRKGGEGGRSPRSPFPRPARLRRHRRLGEEDVPRSHRPRGQGQGRLWRRAGRPGHERALRVPRRPGRAGRIALHARRASTGSWSGRPCPAPGPCSPRHGRSSPTDRLAAPRRPGPPPQEAGRSISFGPCSRGQRAHQDTLLAAPTGAPVLRLPSPRSSASWCRLRPLSPSTRPGLSSTRRSTAGKPGRGSRRTPSRRSPRRPTATSGSGPRKGSFDSTAPGSPSSTAGRHPSSPRARSSPSSRTRTAPSGSGRTEAACCG